MILVVCKSDMREGMSFFDEHPGEGEGMNNKMMQVQDLKKSYKDVQAVNGVSFDVYEGEIFGLLGPNGAGKTTTIEMMEGLRDPDEGQVILDGYSVKKDKKKIRALVGVQLQSTSLFDKLKVREIMVMYASFYKRALKVDDMLHEMNLVEKKNEMVKGLSGGQKQRLAIGLALIHDPKIVFLDEPTTGLDPQARRSLWDIVLKLKARGKTVLLSTHYMEEAHMLCDRLAIMDYGQIIALDTPDRLIASLEMESTVQFNWPVDEQFFSSLAGVTKYSRTKEQITLLTKDLQRTLTALVRWADDQNQPLYELQTRKATLEDVFLQLTGRSLREE